MVHFNQLGEEVFEEELYSLSDLAVSEIKEVLFLLTEHLGVSFVRTNATKHGDTQILLVKHAMEV